MKTSLIALFLILGCSSQKEMQEDPPETLNKVAEYYQQWRKEFNPQTLGQRDYAEKYQHYLRSVAGIFLETDEPEKIDQYLQGLKTNNTQLRLNEAMLDPGNAKTELTQKMSQLNDRLNEQRYRQLQEDLDEETLQRIMEINEEFSGRYESGGPGYNYPL